MPPYFHRLQRDAHAKLNYPALYIAAERRPFLVRQLSIEVLLRLLSALKKSVSKKAGIPVLVVKLAILDFLHNVFSDAAALLKNVVIGILDCDARFLHAFFQFGPDFLCFSLDDI